MVEVSTVEFPKIIQPSRFVNLFWIFNNLEHGHFSDDISLFRHQYYLIGERVVRIIYVRGYSFWEMSF